MNTCCSSVSSTCSYSSALETMISPAWFHQLDSDSLNSGLVGGMCSTECHSSLFSFSAVCGLCLAWYQTELSSCGTVSIFSLVVCAWKVNNQQWVQTKKQTSLLYCRENKMKGFAFTWLKWKFISMHYYFPVLVTLRHVFLFSRSDLFSPLYPASYPFTPFPSASLTPSSCLLPSFGD